MARLILKPFFYIFMPWRIHGIENFPKEGPVIVCANHISMTDPILLAMPIKRQIFFIAKKEVCDAPVIGRILHALGAFPVDRGGNDVRAVRKCISVLKNENILGIFPEGTRIINGKISQAKPGVALITKKGSAPIVMVHIKSKFDKFKLFHRTELYFSKPYCYEELCGDMDYQSASEKILKTIYSLGE